jgi:hypothetical protein
MRAGRKGLYGTYPFFRIHYYFEKGYFSLGAPHNHIYLCDESVDYSPIYFIKKHIQMHICTFFSEFAITSKYDISIWLGASHNHTYLHVR